MNRLKALVAVALAVALAGPGVSAGAAPKLELYTLTNSGGAMFTLTGPHHNLADEGFNDVTRSICGVGVWFLYEDKDYTKHSKFVHTFASATYACENLDSSQWDKVSSVRYA
ncbi:beta/gamma crystallin-related protein, partial [Aphanizomenon sp. 202]|nr:beta/gamma crystallin-related protein [Aphanizomenon sp. 202]